MANNNLKTIQLGAPSSIDGGACPNADLSVQVMSRCTSLSLSDELGVHCTKNGAMLTGVKLLQQKYDEWKQSPTYNCEITYPEAQIDNFLYNGGNIQLSLMVGSIVVNAVFYIERVIEASGNPVSVSSTGLVSLANGYACVVVKARSFDGEYVARQTIIGGATYAQGGKTANILNGVCKQYPSLKKRAMRQHDYIQDGLSMMFSPLTAERWQWQDWVDENYSIPGIHAGVTIGSNGIPTFDAINYYEGQGKAHDPNLYTIEVVYKPDRSSVIEYPYYEWTTANDYYGRCFVISGTNHIVTSIWISKPTCATPEDTDMHTIYFGINNADLYNNKESAILSTADYMNPSRRSDVCLVGIGGSSANTSRAFVGKIYEIRMYDRNLTQEEILHNQSIDLDVYAGL